MTVADERGLYGKYLVDRVDGKGGKGEKHFGCRYFVLDLRHDPHSVPALRAYAESCRESHPALARDLEQLVEMYGTDGESNG